jgi:hypothetical protein
VESLSESTSTSPVVETSEIIEPNDNDLELNVIGYREKTEEMEQELINLRQENIELRKKLAEAKRQQGRRRSLPAYFPLNASHQMLI